MNWNQVEGFWTQFRGRVRESWGVVTHCNSDILHGQRQQAVGKLQRRYGAKQAPHETVAVPVFKTPPGLG